MVKQFYFQESTLKITNHFSERTWSVQMTIKNLKKNLSQLMVGLIDIDVTNIL